MDHFVLTLMNKNFPKSAEKFKLFTLKSKERRLKILTELGEDGYKEVMKKIEKTCKNFKAEDFSD